MPDEVVETASAFVRHVHECPVCQLDGQFVCRTGGELLVAFHLALNKMLATRPYDA